MKGDHMNRNKRKKGATDMKDKWSGLADFLARMIEKYGESLGIEKLPTPEFVYNFVKRSEVYRKYNELMASKKTND